ncbi:MAG: 3-deoxy-D-manno-octulosonic acid transferase [Bacteroidales bacterium]|nr:3-deoxy-D-manno-octulosonic acid transferase [Bacteroidales bacterium]
MLVKGHWQTFRILRHKVDKKARYVWFHAASLGEFEQGRPLMERFRREHPEFKILLTFFSPSGYEVRKNYAGADIICYLPFDTPGNVLSFFRLVHPEMAFFIKYEYWNNFFQACRFKHIPIYMVSAIFRPTQGFFHWWGFYRRWALHNVEHFFVQNEESEQLLASIGFKNVTISGDTRFDRVIDINRQAKDIPFVERFKKQDRILVAGSSWTPDEDIIIPYFNSHPELKLVLAPHVIDEWHLREIESKLKRPFVRVSQIKAEALDGVDCLIVDCFGLLSSIYRYGEVAYVGGGFGVGIHNVPEAAVYGIPVLFGPNNKKFQEAQDLLKLGACHEVTDAESFTALMDRFATDADYLAHCGELSGKYISQNAGASDIIWHHLKL